MLHLLQNKCAVKLFTELYKILHSLLKLQLNDFVSLTSMSMVVIGWCCVYGVCGWYAVGDLVWVVQVVCGV